MAQFEQYKDAPLGLTYDDVAQALEDFGKQIEETEAIECKLEFQHARREMSLTFMRPLEDGSSAGRTIILRMKKGVRRPELVFMSEREFDTTDIWRKLFPHCAA